MHRGEGPSGTAPPLDVSPARRAGRPARLLLHGDPDGYRAHRDAQVPRADRRAAERRLPRGQLRGDRRGQDLRLVPADAERRDDPRRARRRRRPHRRRRPRQAARPPRLRRAAARCPRPRQERGRPELLRLGLGQGHRRRDRVPEDARRGRSRAARRARPLDRRRRARPGRRAAQGPQGRGRRGYGCRVAQGLDPARRSITIRSRRSWQRSSRPSRRPPGQKPGPALEDSVKRRHDAADARLRRPGEGMGRDVRPRGRRRAGRALAPPRRRPHGRHPPGRPQYERRVTAFFDDALGGR